MNTKSVKLSLLRENENNPRILSNEKLEKLIVSLLTFPKMLQERPIVVDEDNMILGGNMRLQALRRIADMTAEEMKESIENVTLSEADKPKEGRKQLCWGYWQQWKREPKVTIIDASDLTDAERKEFIIKDNVNYGQFDWVKLANEWCDMPLDDWGLDTIPEWDIEDEEEPQDKEAKEDGYDVDADVEPRSHFGEIWQCGRHRIICGDSTNIAHLNALLGDTKADLYLTDPPYNVAYEGKTAEKMTIAGDNVSDDNFHQFLLDAFKGASEHIKPGAAFYIWHADTEGYNFRKATKEAGLSLKETLIWNKNAMVMGRQDYQWKHEPCLYGWKSGASHHWYSDRKQTTVIDFNKPTRSDLHPTMKPIGLFGYLMQNSTKENDVVFDGFLGSGTTLIAAEQLERICYGVEYDPKCFDRILARWEALTGQTATLVKTIKQTK